MLYATPARNDPTKEPTTMAGVDEIAEQVRALCAGMQQWYSAGKDAAELERVVLSLLTPSFVIVSARGEQSDYTQLSVTFGAAGG